LRISVVHEAQLHDVTGQGTHGIVEPVGEQRRELHVSSFEIDQKFIGPGVGFPSPSKLVDPQMAVEAFPKVRNTWSDAVLVRVMCPSPNGPV
jgi:hypothetical protein